MDNLKFLVAGNSVLKIRKILKKAEKMTLDWEMRNAVTWNISKTKTILFLKARK